MGRLPEEGSINRNAKLAPGITYLPPVTKGEPPAWPLEDADEPDEWSTIWSKPQASQWKILGCQRLVARYVWAQARYYNDPKGNLLAEINRLEDRLGLSPKAMLSLRWKVQEPETKGPSLSSSKSRVVSED